MRICQEDSQYSRYGRKQNYAEAAVGDEHQEAQRQQDDQNVQ
jgi:hypothetical protein